MSIRRLDIEGGWYGEALVGGAYAVSVDSQDRVDTHLGPIALDPQERGSRGVLYTRCTDVRGFRFAGQSHAGKGTWEYANGAWSIVGASYGVSPVIYDAAGILHVADRSVGSQGYRYVEDGTGRLVTGDETYVDKARAIWEYTTHNTVTIGQGESGCLALFGDDRRIIEPGDCRFIRFNRRGNDVALTIVKLLERKTVLLWMMVADLATFPREGAPVVINPPPPPVSVPPPKGESVFPDTLFQTLEAERANYPALIDQEQAVAILNAVAWQYRTQGVGLLRKESGNNGAQEHTGIKCSSDWLVHRPSGTGSDVFIDGPGINDAGERVKGIAKPTKPGSEPADMSRFVAPVEPHAVTNPPVMVPPPAGKGILEELIANVAGLIASDAAKTKAIEALQAEMTTLQAALANMPTSVAGLQYGDRVALRLADNGKLLCMDKTIALKTSDNGEVRGAAFANRDDAGQWETFTVEKP